MLRLELAPGLWLDITLSGNPTAVEMERSGKGVWKKNTLVYHVDDLKIDFSEGTLQRDLQEHLKRVTEYKDSLLSLHDEDDFIELCGRFIANQVAFLRDMINGQFDSAITAMRGVKREVTQALKSIQIRKGVWMEPITAIETSIKDAVAKRRLDERLEKRQAQLALSSVSKSVLDEMLIEARKEHGVDSNEVAEVLSLMEGEEGEETVTADEANLVPLGDKDDKLRVVGLYSRRSKEYRIVDIGAVKCRYLRPVGNKFPGRKDETLAEAMEREPKVVWRWLTGYKDALVNKALVRKEVTRNVKEAEKTVGGITVSVEEGIYTK